MPPAPNTDDSAALARDRQDMLSKQKEVKLLSPLKQTTRMVSGEFCFVWSVDMH